MPPPQIFSLDGHAFGLTVSGVQIIENVPTDLSPIRWDMPSATNLGSLSFTVEDTGEVSLPYGAVVRFTDNRQDAAHGVEMLTNGTFDSDLTGWTPVLTGSSTAVWDADSGFEGTGDGGLVITGDGVGSAPYVTQTVSVEGGQEVRFHVCLYSVTTYNTAKARLRFLDDADNPVGYSSDFYPTVAGLWAEKVGYWVAPYTATKVEVELSLRTNVVEDAYFDSVSLSVYSRPTTLMSGPLIRKSVRRGVADWHVTDVEVTGWGWFLDHREVQSFTAPVSSTPALKQLLADWGGPIQCSGEFVENGVTSASAATSYGTRTTLRSVIEAMLAPGAATWLENQPYYVDNEREYHHWRDSDGDASHHIVARSIGDGGDFMPESLVWDESAESQLGYVYPYDSGGNPVFYPMRVGYSATGVVTQEQWEAGDNSASLDTIYTSDWLLIAYQVSNYIDDFGSNQASISFSTIEYDGWTPHQEITIDDSIITGGVATTAYVSEVSGVIDDRNTIEWSVRIGNPADSIVHTVVQK